MRKRGRGAEKYIYLWVIVIILMMGWDSPDSLFESEPLPRTISGGFWASFLSMRRETP